MTLALTVFAVSRIVDFGDGTLHLRLDPSVDRLLPEADAEKQYYDRVRRIFGSDETLLIALASDDVFTRDVLSSVLRITERVEQLDGVHHVVSLSTALNIRAQGEDLEIEPFLLRVPESPAELERVRREALDNPVYVGTLLSQDARATALVVYFLEMSEREFSRRGIDAAIAQIAEEERGDARVFITGPPHIKVLTSQTLLRDLRRTLPLVFGGVALVAFAFFRTLRGVLVPLGSVALAVVWTLAAMAWLGRPLNLVTTIVPPLILTLGFAYTVHIVSAYYEALRSAAPEAPMARGLQHVALAVILTGITTMVGFLSLMVSPMGAIREFGLFSVIGVAATMALSLTFAPAVLHLLPPPRRLRRRPESDFWRRTGETLGRVAVEHRTMILAAGALLFVLSLVGMSRLRITSDLVANFPADHAVQRDFQSVNQVLTGANPFYVVVETEYTDAFTDPANLKQISSLQDWLRAQPEIGSATSLVDYVRLIHRGFQGNAPEALIIPDDQEMISQLLMFGANDEIENYVDSRYRSTAILVRSTVIESAPLAELLARIETRLAELPDHLHARITGNSVLLTRTIDDIARSQVESLSLALAVIYLILAVMFTSFRVGAIALIPNVLPVAAFFGLMGWSGVTLTATTSLIACIVLGIAVDDSIHYLARFSEDARRQASEREGTLSALASVLRPVTVTTIAVCLGFAMLTFSELRNQVHFGALAAATLGVAWLLDITLTPALCSGMRVVTLYDVLTLDLGPDPQDSIPLFSGLTRAQARVVALTASVSSFPAGADVVRAGDAADDMFVVIDGELRAQVRQANHDVELERLRRGDVFGEVALLRGTRSADVVALSPVRVLRLTRASLDRLSRRNPRIALRVARNLNDILAKRLAREASRLGVSARAG